MDWPAVRPLGALYAPTTRPLFVLAGRGVKLMGRRCALYAPTLPHVIESMTMRLRCARDVSKAFWVEIEGPTMRPLWAHYAPSICPLRVSALLGSNRWAGNAPTRRLLC